MKKNIFLLIFVVFLSGCNDDILNKAPLDIISDKTVWEDPVLIRSYLTQCYGELGFYNDMPHLAARDFFADMVTSGISDEATSEWNSTAKSHWISIAGGQMEWWGYSTVRRLNLFIARAEESSLTDKISLIAEARFLRAFAYFNMVKRYGGVPLILHEQQIDDPDEELYRKRDKEEDIYQFVIDEMNDIVSKQLLPESYAGNNVTRPNIYVALALKSRAAMYAASIATWGKVQIDGLVGIPAEKANSYWQDSYDASKKILDDNKYALYDKQPDDKVMNYRNIFLEKNHSEIIFVEAYNGISGKGHSWDMWQNPFSYNVWAGGQQNPVYLEMVESYGNIDGTSGVIDRDKIASGYLWTMEELFGKKDPRFHASIYTHETSWMNGDVKLDFHNGVLTEEGVLTTEPYKEVLGRGRCFGRCSPFGILKYLDESWGIVQERYYSKTDWIVFRLSEIYLNLAEAAFELGKQNEALDAVNIVRERAGMPKLQTINRDLIRAERKIELAFEGNRYWDVRRWRTAVEDLTQSYRGLRYILDYRTQKLQIQIVENIAGTPRPYFEEKHYYLPITNARTANNPNLVENPDYK
jgi:SusD family.